MNSKKLRLLWFGSWRGKTEILFPERQLNGQDMWLKRWEFTFHQMKNKQDN